MPRFDTYEDLAIYLATIEVTPNPDINTSGVVVTPVDGGGGVVAMLKHKPSGIVPPPSVPPVPSPPAFISPTMNNTTSTTLTTTHVESVKVRRTPIQLPPISLPVTSDNKWNANSEGTNFIKNRLWCNVVPQALTMDTSNAGNIAGFTSNAGGFTNIDLGLVPNPSRPNQTSDLAVFSNHYCMNDSVGPHNIAVSGGVGKLTYEILWYTAHVTGLTTSLGTPELSSREYYTDWYTVPPVVTMDRSINITFIGSATYRQGCGSMRVIVTDELGQQTKLRYSHVYAFYIRYATINFTFSDYFYYKLGPLETASDGYSMFRRYTSIVWNIPRANEDTSVLYYMAGLAQSTAGTHKIILDTHQYWYNNIHIIHTGSNYFDSQNDGTTPVGYYDPILGPWYSGYLGPKTVWPTSADGWVRVPPVDGVVEDRLPFHNLSSVCDLLYVISLQPAGI